MPAHMSMACDSQMPTSSVLCGCASCTLFRPVPSGIAAVTAIIFSSSFMMLIIASAYAEVNDLDDEASLALSPWTVKGFGEWKVVGSFVAKL